MTASQPRITGDGVDRAIMFWRDQDSRVGLVPVEQRNTPRDTDRWGVNVTKNDHVCLSYYLRVYDAHLPHEALETGQFVCMLLVLYH